MQVKAKLNYLRIAPRKVRLVADLIRGKKIEEAKTLLDFSLKKASRPLKKLLDSTIANATNNFQLDKKNLQISKITVDGGPTLKRWRARARGRAAPIQKRTSSITLILEGREEKMKPVPSKSEEKKKEKKIEQKHLKKPRPETISTRPKTTLTPEKRIFKRKAF